ncbi:hypothetical protein DAETH_29620 [Deinococcus aetherius]|uniref:Polymerase nucleotidyl transferase domain-containing protein n=1 Tax=Deinococcus aetherius TaxID=200252 RepID=A0ABN6RJQ1_9DEIO|nr:hypothetical protein DAETH_29620 [Deinococcus aetherius]
MRDLRAEEGVLAVFLAGSHARGEANEHSDVDVEVLVSSEAQVRNATLYRDGLLFSVGRSTVAHRERAFTDPQTALWNLTALRTGVPLHDPDGVFADLQGRARAFGWASFEEAARARAAHLLAGAVEDVHKVMGGLSRGDDAKVAYACLSLTFELGDAALLETGTLIPTENRYLTLARDAWPDPAWRSAYGTLVGLTGEVVRARGRAALTAFGRAVALTRRVEDHDRTLAHEAARRVQGFLGGA